ncbi:MAG: FAD-dependent oxidoreductase [Candidatus Parvarchaeota archaeon]
MNNNFDIIIAGGGILGVSISFWLSKVTDSKILLIDNNSSIASGTSNLNSGMVEAPFFYDPSTKTIFGESVCRSRKLWRELQVAYKLPWKEVGSLEIALDDESLGVIEKHERWAKSYCPDEEYKVIDTDSLKTIEPKLKAKGAILSYKDAATDYKSLTQVLGTLASHNGVLFLLDAEVVSISEGDNFVEIKILTNGSVHTYTATRFINATGGGALSLANSMGLAHELAEIFIGSYYWKVSDAAGSMFNHHIFSISKYSSQYPFLEPYLAVRVDGTREIGPKPFLVGSHSYRDYGGALDFFASMLKRPIKPKIKLIGNKEFLSMVYNISGNIFSEEAILNKVQTFIPYMKRDFLTGRHKSGKRNIIIGKNGIMHPTAIVKTERTLHIFQYFEPGATGTPSFSSLIAKYLINKWGLRKKTAELDQTIWGFEFASELPIGYLENLLINS